MKLFGSKPKKQRNHEANGEYTEAEKAEGRKLAAKKERKIKHRRIVLLSALLVVVAITSVGAAWYLSGVKPPDITSEADGRVSADNPDDPDGTTPSPSPVSDSDSGRKAGVYTFLVIGMDDGNGNTDTMMLGSFDSVNKTLDIVSIPRDTMVNVSRSTKKINAAYAYGGMDGLKSELKDITGFTPDNYVIVDMDAFKAIVRTIGGVNFDVPYNLDYDDPYQNLHIHISKGYQLLNENQALQVVRWRQNNSGFEVGDTGRVQIQQDFLKALASQCLSIGNLTKVNEFANIFFEYVETDMTVGNLIWYGREFLGMNSEDINFHSVPANTNDYYNGLSYVTIYVDEWLELINEILNPFSEDITVDDLNVLTRNESGTFYATSGVVAGSSSAYMYSSSSSSSSGSGGSSGSTAITGGSSGNGGDAGTSSGSDASPDNSSGGGDSTPSSPSDTSQPDDSGSSSDPQDGGGEEVPDDGTSDGEGSGDGAVSGQPLDITDDLVPQDSDYIPLPEDEQSILID